jgi:hypothetical protein
MAQQRWSRRQSGRRGVAVAGETTGGIDILPDRLPAQQRHRATSRGRSRRTSSRKTVLLLHNHASGEEPYWQPAMVHVARRTAILIGMV